MRILVKVGGAQIEEAPARADLARSVARAIAAGHEIVLVHGGGNQIRALCGRLGIPERQKDGLRVTDAATMDVVVMVLAGLVNKELVLALRVAGVPAAGLSGVDGGLISVRAIADLGRVGAVESVDPRIVHALLRDGLLPVVATVAPGEDGLYNVNADMAAGPLAAGLECDALLFLTDVAGVLDADGARIARLAPGSAASLRASGVIRGGMIPKVDAALAAAAACPALVKIAPATGDDAVCSGLREGIGTVFEREAAWTSTS